MFLLIDGQFASMIYSRGGLTDELYRGTKIAFVWHINDIKNIALALLAAVSAYVEGVNPGMEKYIGEGERKLHRCSKNDFGALTVRLFF